MGMEDYRLLQEKGYSLAGKLDDLAQRASVYHHMYQDSGGRNVFPLIAAHGALWASGYFKKGLFAGKVLSIKYLFHGHRREEQLNSLYDFADKFRDINRRVCAEAYALYYYTKGNLDVFSLGLNYEYSSKLIELLSECHYASTFDEHQRKELFFEFFNWEQENILDPAVEDAYSEFNWCLIKKLALKPNVEFAYFGNKNLQFNNFNSKEERVDKGLKAYLRAEEVGLNKVEGALRLYNILPAEFFNDSAKYHLQLNTSLNA